MTEIAVMRPEWGHLAHIYASADNLRCALLFKGDDQLETGRIVYEGRVLAEGWLEHAARWSLSFDGRKCAVAKAVHDDGGVFHYDVFVNGEFAYRAPDGFEIHYFDWLDDGRLAWEGWYRDEGRRADSRGVRYFVDGVDKTGSFLFQPFLDERLQHTLTVVDGDVRYSVDSGGKRTRVRQNCCKSIMSCYCRRGERSARKDMPDTGVDEAKRRTVVTWNGMTGEWFHGIESRSGMRQFSFNSDRSRVGYIGIRYPATSAFIIDAVQRALEKGFKKADEHEEKGERSHPWWMWPLTLLFNPYMGVGLALVENSKRYYPVNHDHVWRKGYAFISDHFFTPHDELVVIAHEGGKVFVVVDEDEGPRFDLITNVRCDASGCVTYVARDGDRIRSMTVVEKFL